MGWIYSAELAGSPWPYRHGSEPLPTARMTVMRKPCCSVEWQTGQCTLRLSGTMCEPCEMPTSEPQSTLSPEDSPARISALQEMERAWKEADQAYFSKSFASLANFDPDSFSWKTSQLSLFGGLTEFSWSSLRWGTIVDGRLYQPQKWEPRTLESDGSSWPTLTARDFRGSMSDHKLAERMDRTAGPNLQEFVQAHFGVKWITAALCEALMGYPSGHTELSALATQWFRSNRERRLSDCSESEVSA